MKSSTIRLFCAIASMGMLLNGALANAADATISAYFAPDLQDASQNQFTNTTPNAFFCQRWPEACTKHQEFTVGIEGVNFNKHLTVSVPLYVKTPANRRIRMTSAAGDFFIAEFQIVSISQRLAGGPTYYTYPGFSVWGGCDRISSASENFSSQYLWRINNPNLRYPCQSDAYNSASVRISELGIAYRLITPTPHSLVNGVYTAEALYHIGSGGDFDFGPNVTNLSKSTISIAFELTVKHQIKVEFPPGSQLAVLEPQGGWGDWIHRGQQPTRLYRDMPFRLWSAGPFTMHLRCQYSAGSDCAISNTRDNSQVPITVGVTLPSNVALANGGSVRRETLPVGAAAAKQFKSIAIGYGQPAQLHFEAGQAAVQDMLKHAGSTYQGDVTVVFDAQM